jgi:hypothetical protein
MISTTIVSARLVKWLLVFTFVVCFGIEVLGEDSASAAVEQSPLASTSGQSHAIVVCFLGGFVHRDDPHHPEVELIRQLRQEYPTGTYFGLFENRHLNEAYRTIVRELNAESGTPAPGRDVQHARILLFGHSWGGSAVIRLARKLDRAGIPVALTVQVDSVAKPFSDDTLIPPNVAEAANFYQVHGLIHGPSSITAANPERTRIIGNFRRDYPTEPAACRNFPWFSRFFTKGHIEIECDPNVWFEVKALLERFLPNDALNATQVQTVESHRLIPTTELVKPARTDILQSPPSGRN